MTILVKVTKDVLERSKMCGFVTGSIVENCMLAIAFRDLFPKALVFSKVVDLLGWAIDGNNYYDRVTLPEIAIENREIFDRCYTPEQRVLMSPFSFELEVPEYVIEKIGLSQIYKVLSESRTLEHINK